MSDCLYFSKSWHACVPLQIHPAQQRRAYCLEHATEYNCSRICTYVRINFGVQRCTMVFKDGHSHVNDWSSKSTHPDNKKSFAFQGSVLWFRHHHIVTIVFVPTHDKIFEKNTARFHPSRPKSLLEKQRHSTVKKNGWSTTLSDVSLFFSIQPHWACHRI